MPLSISKLQNFLARKGFIANKYFVMNGSCFFIELFCLKTADISLLYIPSKYYIQVNFKENVYKIKYIDMESSDNLPDEYAGQPNNFDIENTYGNMQVLLSPDKDRLEEHLENNYRHAISLKDISKDDTIDLKALYRQLKRLKYCVQNLSYKLGIIYKNYICAIRRDDTIDCFAIKNYTRGHCKQLMVIIDLETFYEKNEKVIDDIHIVRESIYRVLERNQNNHGHIIEKIIENKKDISVIPQLAEIKKARYSTMITQLEEMLAIMSDAEQKVLGQLQEINSDNTTGLQKDITRVHHKAQLEKELDKINNIRGAISKNMFILREKSDDAVLSIDKIVFDNTVMFDCMVRNFAKLKDFC